MGARTAAYVPRGSRYEKSNHIARRCRDALVWPVWPCGVWRTAVFERRGRKREDGESRKGRLRERRYAGALCGWGGTTVPMYDGKNFAKAHGDAILVTCNYRLGLMAWADLKAISGEDWMKLD